eukprot:scaffold39526_cov292-Isochrysis_galbana.AAC.1
MVSSSFDPFLPTAAELAGDALADSTSNFQPSERQARHLLAHRAQPAHQYNSKQLMAFMHEPLNPSTPHRMRIQPKTQLFTSKSLSGPSITLNTTVSILILQL